MGYYSALPWATSLVHFPLPPCPLWSNGAVNDYTPDYTNKREPVILGLVSLHPCPNVAAPFLPCQSTYRQGCQEVRRHSRQQRLLTTMTKAQGQLSAPGCEFRWQKPLAGTRRPLGPTPPGGCSHRGQEQAGSGLSSFACDIPIL